MVRAAAEHLVDEVLGRRDGLSALSAARDVPAAKPYRYAMLPDKVLIVNPADKKIADVVQK